MNVQRSLLLSLSSDVALLWNPATYENVRAIRAQNTAFEDAHFTPDGALIATLFKDCTLYFWNATTFEAERRINDLAPTAMIKKFAISFNMKRIAAGGASSFLFVWTLPDAGSPSRRNYRLPEGCHNID